MLSMTIGNMISIVLVAGFAILAPLAGLSWSAYGLHLAAGIIMLLAAFTLFAVGAVGGGDAKLLTATALWMGPSIALAKYLVWAAMLGGLLTLALLALRYSPLAPAASNTRLLRHVADKNAGIPYGIALGAAGLLASPYSPLGAWALASI